LASGSGRAREVGSAAIGGQASSFAPVSDLQRSRLLAAVVAVVDELGYAGASVAHVTAGARVSRRTFYELFADRDECFAAALGEIAGEIERELAFAAITDLAWRERLRFGLWQILAFLEREPVLARVCVVQALGAGGAVVQCRQEVLQRLIAVVDEGRAQGSRGADCGEVLAEGLVGAAFAIVHARLLREETELTRLFGELLELILLPYLGPAAARRERERELPVPPAPEKGGLEPGVMYGLGDPLCGVRMRVTYRTMRVLVGVGELSARGGHPSNREIGVSAGVNDAGQISKLLRRLEQLGLLCNIEAGHGKGTPNAWALTPEGETLVQRICGRAAVVDRRAA
jgi:AcrR family transcriptional regulator